MHAIKEVLDALLDAIIETTAHSIICLLRFYKQLMPTIEKVLERIQRLLVTLGERAIH